MQIISSCAVSFILISGIHAIDYTWLHLNVDTCSVTVIAVICSVVIAPILSMVYISRWFHSFLVKSFGVSPHNSVWRNVIPYNSGANLKIVFKGSSHYYIGHLYSYEENGSDSRFCIQSPMEFIKNDAGDDTLCYTQESNERAFLTFNLNDTELVEIFK